MVESQSVDAIVCHQISISVSFAQAPNSAFFIQITTLITTRHYFSSGEMVQEEEHTSTQALPNRLSCCSLSLSSSQPALIASSPGTWTFCFWFWVLFSSGHCIRVLLQLSTGRSGTVWGKRATSSSWREMIDEDWRRGNRLKGGLSRSRKKRKRREVNEEKFGNGNRRKEKRKVTRFSSQIFNSGWQSQSNSALQRSFSGSLPSIFGTTTHSG